MRELLKRPLAWAALGVVVLLVAVFLERGGDDNDAAGLVPLEAALTETVAGLPDGIAGADLSTSTVFDVTDDPLTSGATDTVGDVEDDSDPSPAEPEEQVGDAPTSEEVSALLIADETDQCLWAVNIQGQNLQKLFLVAWPSGTEVEWDPLEVRLPDGSEPLGISSPFVADGSLFNSFGQVPASDQERVGGMERCENEGVLVLDDQPDNVQSDG